MFYFYFFEEKFYLFCQSGFFFDFFLKKISEVFLRNILIYSSLFLGEKFFIEYLTKKIFQKNLLILNYYLGVKVINFNFFFFNFLFFLFLLYILFFFIIYFF